MAKSGLGNDCAGALAGSAYTLAAWQWRDRLRAAVVQRLPRLVAATTPIGRRLESELAAIETQNVKRTKNTTNVHWRAARQRGIRLMLGVRCLGPIFHIGYMEYQRLTPAAAYGQALRVRMNKKALYPDRCACVLGIVGFNWRRGAGLMLGVTAGTVFGYAVAWLRGDARMIGVGGGEMID